jgi:catechol 2,3-dioxygenase-like lactoylglutathione lyase family enzyme
VGSAAILTPIEKRWKAMLKFDHLTLSVSDWRRSRDWYVRHLGMKVEFEIPDRCTAAVQDEHDFTIFLQQSVALVRSVGVALYFQVADVEASFQHVSALGVSFVHPLRNAFWGYGAELSDPDGYLIRLWDQRSMKTKGES